MTSYFELHTKALQLINSMEIIVMSYWEITPHKSEEYDCCIMPAETENDHRDALVYAQEILESLWDSTAWEGSPKKVTVTMEIKEGSMPDIKIY